MQRAVRRTGDQHAKALLVEAGRRVDERLAEVDRQMAERQTQFASKSTVITARLQKISTSESPRDRISSQKGGRWLPENSLFR
jgi:Tfp pilus assembly protein PilN